MADPYVEFYKETPTVDPGDEHLIDVEPEWRWRVKAGNHEIVASGEGYTRESDAIRGWEAARSAVLRVRLWRHADSVGD